MPHAQTALPRPQSFAPPSSVGELVRKPPPSHALAGDRGVDARGATLQWATHSPLPPKPALGPAQTTSTTAGHTQDTALGTAQPLWGLPPVVPPVPPPPPALSVSQRCCAVTDEMLRGFFDLVIWGHEHECIQEPLMVQDGDRSFDILQPGSSIVTSLSVEEAKPKHCCVLEVWKTQYKVCARARGGVPTRQLLGSANPETTPARAPAAAADRK